MVSYHSFLLLPYSSVFRLSKSVSSSRSLLFAGNVVNSLQWLETAIALLFVCLRLWTRIRITQTAGWDDYLIVLSWVRNVLSDPDNTMTELPIVDVDAVHRRMHSCCYAWFWKTFYRAHSRRNCSSNQS